MDPTLKDGERVAVNIIGYKTGGLEKGNVVVFHANKNDDYVKRCLLYTSPSPRDMRRSRMPSSA
ncbi:hypothetical protein JMUB7527_28430 [Staphylococcus aureus]